MAFSPSRKNPDGKNINLMKILKKERKTFSGEWEELFGCFGATAMRGALIWK